MSAFTCISLQLERERKAQAHERCDERHDEHQSAAAHAPTITLYKTLPMRHAPATTRGDARTMPKITIDVLRCEGAKKCVQLCPEKVFALRKPDYPLPLLVRLKVLAHGGKQAVVMTEAACTLCMKCVEACPERAITVAA
jgi:NAD-dependent dihydropyrimidine dehydrogenase PreA subunit